MLARTLPAESAGFAREPPAIGQLDEIGLDEGHGALRVGGAVGGILRTHITALGEMMAALRAPDFGTCLHENATNAFQQPQRVMFPHIDAGMHTEFQFTADKANERGDAVPRATTSGRARRRQALWQFDPQTMQKRAVAECGLCKKIHYLPHNATPYQLHK